MDVDPLVAGQAEAAAQSRFGVIPDGPPTGRESEAKRRDTRPWRKRQQAELTSADRGAAIDQFRENIRALRLVHNMGTNKIDGIATWNPESGSWDIRSVETRVQELYREVGLKLLTDLTGQLVSPVLAPSTKLDIAVKVATDVLNPSTVISKLCNAAMQAVAHAHGLGG